MKKPVIGILGAHMSNNGGPAPVPADYVNHAYCSGVENAGGIPLDVYQRQELYLPNGSGQRPSC